MRRIPMLLTVMMAAMVAFSGAALAQGGDVCVSIKGQPKVQKGDSICESDSTSKAVAVDDSDADADEGCTLTAHNGEIVECP